MMIPKREQAALNMNPWQQRQQQHDGLTESQRPRSEQSSSAIRHHHKHRRRSYGSLLFLLLSWTTDDCRILSHAFTSETATAISTTTFTPLLSSPSNQMYVKTSQPASLSRRRRQRRRNNGRLLIWNHLCFTPLQMTMNVDDGEASSSSPEEEEHDKANNADPSNSKTPSPSKRRKPRNKPAPVEKQDPLHSLQNHSHSHDHHPINSMNSVNNNNNNITTTNNSNNSLKKQQPQQRTKNKNSQHPKSTLNQTSTTTTTTTTTSSAAATTTAKPTPFSFIIPSIAPPPSGPSPVELELLSRVKQLEQMVAKQSVELKRLKHECHDLNEAVAAFANVADLLRQAGLQIHEDDDDEHDGSSKTKKQTSPDSKEKRTGSALSDSFRPGATSATNIVHESEIFGSAPSSLTHAADAAGAAILAGMLGGKQRMLIDVRDAELSRDPEILVQFIELAILPVAAGLEGLQSTRNRVKIVFPTVSQLLQYRRTMALAAPEVVALSTLGFDPVEKRDNLVVIVAPAPDDEEGLTAMNELFAPTDPTNKPIRQPVVVLNHHMLPVAGPAASFEVAYHLRLLNVQYMSSEIAPQYFPHLEGDIDLNDDDDDLINEEQNELGTRTTNFNGNAYRQSNVTDDVAMNDALEAAMKHAHEVGKNQGVTRAMVIRAFPRPWHVFVDTSPDTNADFEVAATFIEEPTQEEVNMAIVECLEGSEREDELVAQQMQQALESGQLDRVSELLERLALTDEGDTSADDDEDDDDDDDLFGDFDRYEEDSV